MKITGLGHSAFVFEMASPAGEPVRILVDPWLSDYVVGDLAGRFPRLRLDPADLMPLDGIWLSHSHTDHLDPESLLRLQKALDPFPALLLPTSLAHLVPLLDRYLDPAETMLLGEGEETGFRGLTLNGFYNPEREASNEDDVMVLVASSGQKALVAESDAVLPYGDPALRALLADLLLGPEVETAALLTTKNHLGATMAMLAATDRENRLERLSFALEAVYDELWQLYGPAAEDPEDLFRDPRLVRLVGGQGIAVPPEAGTDWNRVLFPISIADRVRMEREVAAQCECAHEVGALAPAEVHEVRAGGLVRSPAPHLTPLDSEADRRFDPDLDLFGPFPVTPLRDEERDPKRQEARILAFLRDRFLPFLTGRRNPPLEQLLAAGGGEWRIRFRFVAEGVCEDRDFTIRYDRREFVPGPEEGDAHEHYFASDLEDVLDGRADEFSTFCRGPLPAPAQHLWLATGMPWLCPDLVEKKLRYHFERCAAGETNADFVTPFWR